MVNKDRTPAGRDQRLILLFVAALLILISFAHKPHLLGSSNSLKVVGKKDILCVEVCGEVRYPGIYDFHGKVTVHDAIRKAGGLSDDLTIDRTLESVRLKNGEKVTVRRTSRRKGRVLTDWMDAKKRIILSIPIDINTATPEELIAVPGVGPQIAQRIIDYRNERGEFAAKEDLVKVKGIGKVRYERMNHYLCVCSALQPGNHLQGSNIDG